MSLLDHCIAAHGGRAAFERLDAVEVRLRCSGLALAAKLRPRAVADVRAHVDVHAGHVELAGLGSWTRADSRPRGMPWRVRWGDREVAHFVGYALWNYLAAPFIWDDCEVRELPGRRLALRFRDPGITHCRDQTAYLDADGRIARLDYTAEVFGPWARAANRCLAYEWWDGVLIPVRRRVTPRGLPRRPVLVGIEIERQAAASSAGAVR